MNKYYASTNEYSQLAFISAEQITVQDESSGIVNDSGQCCDDPATVSGDSNTPSTVSISYRLGSQLMGYNFNN